MTSVRRVQAGLVVLGAMIVAGTVGYMVLADLGLIDALYLTMITVTTVGFRELGEQTDAVQLFTIGIIVGGTGAALYTAANGLEVGLEAFLGGERRRRRMERAIERLRHHVILCGFGRVGRTAWDELSAEGTDVVVIDTESDNVADAVEMGAIAFEGDATSEDVLVRAGLDRARVLVSAVRSDSDNLVITLVAKARRPDIIVVARVVEAESERKLFMAGADRVVAPQLVGGQRLAALALKPDLIEFIDLVVSGRTVEFQVEEFEIEPEVEVVGKSILELDFRRRSGALILAVGDTHGTLVLNPDPQMVFKPGQVVIAVGTTDQLDALRPLMHR